MSNKEQETGILYAFCAWEPFNDMYEFKKIQYVYIEKQESEVFNPEFVKERLEKFAISPLLVDFYGACHLPSNLSAFARLERYGAWLTIDDMQCWLGYNWRSHFPNNVEDYMHLYTLYLRCKQGSYMKQFLHDKLVELCKGENVLHLPVELCYNPVNKDIGKSRAVKPASRAIDYKEYVEDTKEILQEIYNALFLDINVLPDEVAYNLIKDVRETVGEMINDCKKREKELNMLLS